MSIENKELILQQIKEDCDTLKLNDHFLKQNVKVRTINKVLKKEVEVIDISKTISDYLKQRSKDKKLERADYQKIDSLFEELVPPYEEVLFLPQAFVDDCNKGHLDMIVGIQCNAAWFQRKIEDMEQSYNWVLHDLLFIQKALKYPELKSKVDHLHESATYKRELKTHLSFKKQEEAMLNRELTSL